MQVENTYIEGVEPYDSLYKLNVGYSLDETSSQRALEEIYREKNSKKRIYLLTALLTMMMAKGPTVDEVNGLLRATFSLDELFETTKFHVDLPNGEILLGCAGSGKKGIKTFNISTPAAIVAASCGVYIAKASSASTSSITGSSDFLSMIGINLKLPFDEKIDILKKNKMAFFSIEDTTPKFAKLYEGTFYAPHALSFGLAGLSFPVKIDAIAYGLSHPNIKLSRDVLVCNNLKNVVVYSSTEDGIHFIDEVGVSGVCNIIDYMEDCVGISKTFKVSDEVPISRQYSIKEIMSKNNARDNVSVALRALKNIGEEACIDAVCINAGLYIYLAQKANSLAAGYLMARKSITEQKAFEYLLNIAKCYGGSIDAINKFIKE